MINRKLIAFLCLIVTCWSIGSVVFGPEQRFFVPYYTEAIYKNLENLYNASQYRLKEPTALIADEIVFRYAAGAYIRGVDPILINSEHTPLGKYFIGASILLFQTDTVAIVFFGVLSLVTLWFLGRLALGDSIWALVPVALWSNEKLFRNQFLVTPLLDIIQLPFVLLTLLAFIKEQKKGIYIWTALALGFVAATKSVVPTILLVVTFVGFLVVKRRFRHITNFFLWLPISLGVLALSYTRTFFNGYSFWDFLGFQKWILLYQQSKLIFPFSFWRLMLFNQWQTWWGEMKVMPVEDWRWTWPVLVLVPLGLVLVYRRKIVKNSPLLVLLLWAFVYEVFLSFGIVATRFFLPLLPVLYVLLVYSGREILRKRGVRI